MIVSDSRFVLAHKRIINPVNASGFVTIFFRLAIKLEYFCINGKKNKREKTPQ